MSAVWQPNTPRYACASSTTTNLQEGVQFYNFAFEDSLRQISIVKVNLQSELENKSY